MDSVQRAIRHGWKCVGIKIIGNTVYTVLEFHRNAIEIRIAIYQPTGRAFHLSTIDRSPCNDHA